jgi:hypothetical protein
MDAERLVDRFDNSHRPGSRSGCIICGYAPSARVQHAWERNVDQDLSLVEQ